jgi:hypothetical protein
MGYKRNNFRIMLSSMIISGSGRLILGNLPEGTAPGQAPYLGWLYTTAL